MPEPTGPASTLLRDHTTLRLGGPARHWVRATSTDDLVAAVVAADEGREPVLVLAGGSNLVVADAGFDGTVVEVATTGVRTDSDPTGAPSEDPACGGELVTVAAGEDWDAFCARAVTSGWVGVEALSGIPGSVGATPVQNVGAYGQEVAQTIWSVTAWDRHEGRRRTLAAAECGFGYRDSRFKREPGRWLVLEVTFQLLRGDLGAPVAYAELARALGVAEGGRAPLTAVRDAVLGLRRGKGMVLDADDHDSWSAGSFFTNPVLDEAGVARLPDDAPRWPVDGGVKTSAAWLIQHAGFDRGHGPGARGGRVGLSTKHTLALTNRGDATTSELLGLAREVRDGVEAAYGIRLVNEPVLVGCSL